MTFETTKKNVSKFDADVAATGSYAYTSDKLSAKMAMGRLTECIIESYDFKGKTVLDLGCGDGTYSVMIPAWGAKEVLGVDPAAVALESAARRAKDAGVADKVSFAVGNIYALEELLGDRRFDVVMLRAMLHHLPDPKKAIECAARFGDAVVIMEPNGYNPVLKVLEKLSRYHVEHEEQSFMPATIKAWCRAAGLKVERSKFINIVVMFCPDWFAKFCKFFEPVVEAIPLLRAVACGQVVMVAKH